METRSYTCKYPCASCKKSVKNNQKGLRCTKCKQWLHISCAGVSGKSYDDPSENFIDWQCNICIFKSMPLHGFPENEPRSQVKNSSCRVKSKSQCNFTYKELNGCGLKIAQLNVNSILKHIDEVRSLVKSNNIHLLALNETKVDNTIFDDEIKIENFSIIRRDRNRHGGGVAIYIHKSLHYDELNHDSMKELEIVSVKIYLKGSKPVVFSTWYRPPSSNVDVLELFESFVSYLDGLSLDTILVGDVNCDILSTSVSNMTRRYQDINNTYGLVHINKTIPTRVTHVSTTLVDHMITNCPSKVKKFGVIHNGMSDHSISYLQWNCEATSPPRLISFRNCKNLDPDKFRDDVRGQDWSKLAECQTIDEAVSTWQNLLLRVVNKHMPIRCKRIRDRDSPWMKSDIYKLMRKRDKIKKKACKLKDEKLMCVYRKLRNKVSSEIAKAKKKYYSDKLAECNNSKNTWKTLKSIIPDKKGDSSIAVNSDNTLKTADSFNNFFASVGSDLAKNIPNVPSAHENLNRIDDSFEFTPVNESDVLDILRNLRNTKSVGLDGISVFVLKLCAHEITPSINYLINLSLKSGKFPKQWKIAKIIPIHKNGDKDTPSNFRPISLLPCVSKILERIVQRQIVSYLHKHNILSSAQSGFRTKHSTITTLIKVTDDWFHAIDKKEFTGAVFVDLKKAFDTVDWDILLKKLRDIGINGTALSWMESYLTNRVCRTLVNSELSSESSITCGVPQGSLLGPLFFIIYINDLVDCVKSCKVQLYADDTVLYFSNSSMQNIESALNSDLENVSKWMSKNKLTVNCKKTECMLIGNKHMLAKHNVLKVTLNDTPLNQVHEFKYLGLICDETLSWNRHIESLLSKIGKMVGFLGRLRHSLNESVVNSIYKALIIPYFDYGDAIYGSACKTYIEKLQKVQNRAARIILKVKKESHVSVSEMHNALGWQFLDNRRNHNSIVLMYKVMHDLTPSYVRNEFELAPQHYSSRFGEKLLLPKPRTESLKKSFKYRGAKAYNSLPSEIKSSPSIHVFKSNLK